MNLNDIIFPWMRVVALLAAMPMTSLLHGQSNGSVDTSFGTRNNWAVFDVLNGDMDIRGSVTDLLPRHDGKVVAAGYCSMVFGSGACLYRWSSNGSPDTTFGAQGAALVFVGATSTAQRQRVRALQRTNGSVFVAASCNHASFGIGICVAAVNANGAGFDTSFGGTGQTFLPLPSGYANVVLDSIALQPDGRLLVGATCYLGAVETSNSSVCVARLTSGAVFDPTFGVGNWSLTTPGPGDRLQKLQLLSDGRYFAIARCGNSDSASSICASLYTSGGGFQRTIAVDAVNLADNLEDARLFGNQLTLQWSARGSTSPYGRIYAARREFVTSVASYDNSFGGYPSTGVAGDFNLDSSNDGSAHTGSILNDGSFFFAGKCNFLDVLCTLRLTPNGILDASYGVGGRYEYAGQYGPWSTNGFGPLWKVLASRETTDRKVLVAGECKDNSDTFRPCVIRIHGGPVTARNCTMDIDGDGLINESTDGTILRRLMQGMSGSAALVGAVGATATRTTWAQVRDYLSDQCQMQVPVS